MYPPPRISREHGVLDRVLLIYEEILARNDSAKEVASASLQDAAGIVRKFIEDYPQKLEEEYLFPRFEKSGKLVEIVRVLRGQNLAGRKLQFEDQEHKLFGGEGFEKIVQQVAEIERRLGIEDLAQLTPREARAR